MSALFLFMLACGDVATESEPIKKTPVQIKPIEKSNKQEQTTKSIIADAEKVEQEALTPSPLETRKAAENEGLTSDLSTFIQNI